MNAVAAGAVGGAGGSAACAAAAAAAAAAAGGSCSSTSSSSGVASAAGISGGSGGAGGGSTGPKEKESTHLVAVLILHLPQKYQQEQPEPLAAGRQTWSCVRKVREGRRAARLSPLLTSPSRGRLFQISDLHSLHRDLVPYVDWVKHLDLPPLSVNKPMFGRSSAAGQKAALEKARVLVQRYLDSVLLDEQLNQSEVLYAFLSPSPSHLKSLHLSPRRVIAIAKSDRFLLVRSHVMGLTQGSTICLRVANFITFPMLITNPGGDPRHLNCINCNVPKVHLTLDRRPTDPLQLRDD